MLNEEGIRKTLYEAMNEAESLNAIIYEHLHQSGYIELSNRFHNTQHKLLENIKFNVKNEDIK